MVALTPLHLALPLRVTGTGGFAVVEQDSPSEVAQNVAVILSTPLGSRVEVPEFGSPRPEFVGPDSAGMVAAVEEWEPRADLTTQVVVAAAGQESLTAVKAFVTRNA